MPYGGRVMRTLPLSVFDDIADVLDTHLFSTDGTAVTLTSVLLAVAGIVAAWIVARWVARGLVARILGRLDVDQSVHYAIARIAQYTILAIGMVISLDAVGINLSTVAVVLGFFAVGIGFGLQNLTANFISGLILLVERPVRVGDRITIGDHVGTVEAIRVRATILRSLDNTAIIVPNADLISQRVINHTLGDPRIVLWTDVGVAVDSDLDTVTAALLDVARNNPDILPEPEPAVRLREFGNSAWNMRVIGWIADPDQVYRVTSDLNMAIVRAFRERGIVIPYPQRDVHLRGPLPLTAPSPTDASR